VAICSCSCSFSAAWRDDRAAVASLPRGEVEAVARQFLASIGSSSGAGSVSSLGTRFPADDEQRSALSRGIDGLVDAIGAVEGVECLGWRLPTGGQRFGAVVFLTYHPRGIAVWQLAAMDRANGWTIVHVKFSTEGVPEQLHELGFLERESPESVTDD
jgi:hypothetical protein